MDINTNSHNETLYGLRLKAKSAIIFVLNLLIVVPFILRDFQFGFVVVAIALLAFIFYITVAKIDERVDLSASGMLPLLLFTDILLVLLKAYQPLCQFFDTVKPNINWDVATLPFSGLLIVGGVLCFASFSKLETSLWVFTLGALIIGFAFTIVTWHTLDFDNFHFKRNGEIIFLLYCGFAFVWFLFSSFSGFCNPNKAGKVCLLSVLTVVLTYVLNFQERAFLKDISKELSDILYQLPDTAFAWWKIILIFLVLGGCAAAMEDNNKLFIGMDSYVMFALASMAIIFKVYLENYFYLSWIVLIISIAAFLVGLKCQAERKLVFGYSDVMFIVGVLIVSLIGILWIHNGYWMNVLLLGIFILILHRIHSFAFVSQNKPWIWIMILVFVAANGIAYLMVECFIIESIIIIGVFLLVSCIVMYILNYPHPSGHAAPFFTKAIVVILLSIVCLIPSLGAGFDIKIEPDAAENRVAILLEPRSRKNAIDSAYCYWTGDDGEITGKKINIRDGDADIKIREKKLTVVIKDESGRITTKIKWFPNRYVSN